MCFDSKIFLNAECKIVLFNKFTGGAFFNYKYKFPAVVRSSLVYKFSCAQCASTYIHTLVQPVVCCELELQSMLGGAIEQGLGWLTLRIRPSASMRKGVLSVWCWITSVF